MTRRPHWIQMATIEQLEVMTGLVVDIVRLPWHETGRQRFLYNQIRNCCIKKAANYERRGGPARAYRWAA